MERTGQVVDRLDGIEVNEYVHGGMYRERERERERGGGDGGRKGG